LKKLLLILASALLVIGLFAGPALAAPVEHGRFCLTYRNNDHSKQIKVCTELEQSDTAPGTWWARTETVHVAGFSEPYAVQTFTDFFSAPASNGPWCPGTAPACNTNPTNSTFFQPLDGDQSNTAHYPEWARYCYLEAHATVLVYYNSTQYANGLPGDANDVFSGDSYTNNPSGGWCIT
jgi:hypothetical protein